MKSSKEEPSPDPEPAESAQDPKTIKIVIDKREVKLIQMVKEADIGKLCEFSELPVGDIIMYYNGVLFCVIERKTINDLARSIIDRRYQSQKFRLTKFCQENNVSPRTIEILIEGFFSGIDQSTGKLINYTESMMISGIKYSTLISSVVNMQVRDRFTITHTLNTLGTFNYLIKKVKCLEKYGQSIYSGKEPTEDPELGNKIDAFIKSNVRVCKKANVDYSNCFLNQLAIIPGISIKKAKLIADNYNNMFALVATYNAKKTQSEKAQLLMSCGLGKILSTRVYEYLCSSGAESSGALATESTKK